MLAEPGIAATRTTPPVTPASTTTEGDGPIASSGDVAAQAETPGTGTAAEEQPPSSATNAGSKAEAGAAEAEAETLDRDGGGGAPATEGEKGDSSVADASEVKEGGEQGGEVAAPPPAAAAVAAEAVVLAEGPYSSGVLVALDPARPTVLKLTVGEGQGQDAVGGGGGGEATVLIVGAVDG